MRCSDAARASTAVRADRSRAATTRTSAPLTLGPCTAVIKRAATRLHAWSKMMVALHDLRHPGRGRVVLLASARPCARVSRPGSWTQMSRLAQSARSAVMTADLAQVDAARDARRKRHGANSSPLSARAAMVLRCSGWCVAAAENPDGDDRPGLQKVEYQLNQRRDRARRLSDARWRGCRLPGRRCCSDRVSATGKAPATGWRAPGATTWQVDSLEIRCPDAVEMPDNAHRRRRVSRAFSLVGLGLWACPTWTADAANGG